MGTLTGDDHYTMVRTRAHQLGLGLKAPSEWGPCSFDCPSCKTGRVVLEDGLNGEASVFCDHYCLPEDTLAAMDLPALLLGQPLKPEPPATGGPAPPVVAPGPNGREIVWTELADIKPRPVRWLWHPYFPLGKVSLVVGAPGNGKSQLTAWLAAATTRAGLYPGDVEIPSDVGIVFAEDDAEDTVVPRLLAAGADIRRISTVNAREQHGFDLTMDGLIRLPGDVETLYRRLQARPEMRLLIFDPVMSYLGREYKGVIGQDVREAVGPLKALAERFNVAIVLILHVNKQSEVQEWAARISDSHAWQAIARSIVALAPDPEDPDGDEGSLKILALPKSNLIARKGRSVRFRIEPCDVPTDHGTSHTSRLELLGACDIAADDLLMGKEQRTAAMEARAWMEDYLGDEWHRSSQMKSDAIKEGYAWRTIERVRPSICQRPLRQHGVEHGAYWIALKSTTSPPPWTQGTGGPGGDDGATSATSARTPYSDLSEVDNHRQDRQGSLDLEAYRAKRDAMLGERPKGMGDDDD